MNRNFLFTELYAWGRTIDTEQLVGVTSRSPRYYVSAAYWDRDAMLWSFPALLDIDPPMAREALEYALTTQLRNTGTHSRFIDGVVLEDGFQLDEAAAPILALAAYEKRTNDTAFLSAHSAALAMLSDRLQSRFDPATGLYSSLQDAQDEFQKLPFITYDNALVWRAFTDLADLNKRLNDLKASQEMTTRAASLHAAILNHCVSTSRTQLRAAPSSPPPPMARTTSSPTFRPALSSSFPPSASSLNPIRPSCARISGCTRRTTSTPTPTSLTDFPEATASPSQPHGASPTNLLLTAGRDQSLKILRASNWDGGIITEGVDPATARMDQAGRAFATAAGYIAHAICQTSCTDNPK